MAAGAMQELEVAAAEMPHGAERERDTLASTFFPVLLCQCCPLAKLTWEPGNQICRDQSSCDECWGRRKDGFDQHIAPLGIWQD